MDATENEFKGTRGPWQIANYSPDRETGGYYVKATLPGHIPYKVCALVDRAPDAHLIAAAPELLEALDQVLNAALAYQLREEDAAVVYARAVIAKALGGSA